MSLPSSVGYVEAKARVTRAISRITTFAAAAGEHKSDPQNVGKRSKIIKMLLELNDIRKKVEEDIQIMEKSVSEHTAPIDITDNSDSLSLSTSFDNFYYELAAFADVHKMSLSSIPDQSLLSSTVQPFNTSSNISHYQLPTRKFPTFSGIITEWQGFEDLFNSILSHAPDLPDVEKFEFLKTSLQGEAWSLIAHLPLTAANYHSAWDILRTRYGNKRDLARLHLEALLTPHTVQSNDAHSIKTLINSILEHTAALDNLDLVTRCWSPLLVHIFEQHLDYDLRARWEMTIGDRHQPQTSEFVDFLRSHVRSAEARSGTYFSSVTGTTSIQKLNRKPQFSKPRQFGSPKVLIATTSHPSVQTFSCPLCRQSHSIRKCSIFLNQAPNERFQTIKKLQLCINCLSAGHTTAGCQSKHTCQSCKKQHHSLLHFPVNTSTVESFSPPTAMLVSPVKPQTVLLSTLLVSVSSVDNGKHTLRALLDTGAQVSFITKQCADRLSLPRRRCSTQVNAFSGASVDVVSGITSITMSPVGKAEPSIQLDVFIVSKISDEIPQSTFTFSSWSHLENLELADPTFNVKGPIDILLGSDIIPTLFTGTRCAGKQSQPTAFGTLFGWVLMGPVTSIENNSVTSLLVTTNVPLEQSLKKFWEMEEPPQKQHLSPDEVQAEAIFTSSIRRLDSGRFSIALPFKKPHPILGNSKCMAQKRLNYLEHRLFRNPELHDQYMDFMKEYLENQHMEIVPISQRMTPFCYYIPHHCVLRPESQTTKLRVVFDASASTTAGLSLNNSLYTGRKLQQDLPQILICSRVHKVLFTADIKQMYRQIEIHPEDRDYLRILWWFDRNMPIEEYRLCTVTYGTSCAPYQALRTLKHLATIEESKFPKAAKIIMQDTFVDDILTGANSEEEAVDCQNQLIELCAQGQFKLRKWASNSSAILQSVPDSDCSMSTAVLFDDELEAGLKILGMKWSPKQDHFSYTFQSPCVKTTKRSILSDLARIFDPLGFLSPITFLAKYIMQLLWTSGIGWDDEIPEKILTMWRRFQDELQCIQQLRIPRRVTIDGNPNYELHTFSDSSEKGYAAAVYLRCDNGAKVECFLIIAKSKVSPLKRVTIPRLELCGAVLAAKLLHYVHEILKSVIPINAMHAWTDSTTTLAWIQSSPHRWATFIANRTSELQSLTPPSLWRYVPTTDNPVDCASRGLYPRELLQHPLWWNGPLFLTMDKSTWPPKPTNIESDLTAVEARPSVFFVTTTTSIFEKLLINLSSLQKLLRIVAYCRRAFVKVKSSTTILSPAELAHALRIVILAVQKQIFFDEYKRFQAPTKLGSSKLRGLNLFLDEHGILRVGGRLDNADIPYQQKHPILLPRSHRLTDLIVEEFHQNLKHPGATTLQSIIQQQYWIISSRQVIRSRLRHCIACYRIRPRVVQPLMGDLPKYRLQQVKPFIITGVDYAGPITLKSSTTR